MNREQAITYIGHCVDDALSPRDPGNMPPTARLVGWQCGFEPMFVAVWSAYDQPGDKIKFDADEAVEIAMDYLSEIGWFGELQEGEDPPQPDYVL